MKRTSTSRWNNKRKIWNERTSTSNENTCYEDYSLKVNNNNHFRTKKAIEVACEDEKLWVDLETKRFKGAVWDVGLDRPKAGSRFFLPRQILKLYWYMHRYLFSWIASCDALGNGLKSGTFSHPSIRFRFSHKTRKLLWNFRRSRFWGSSFPGRPVGRDKSRAGRAWHRHTVAQGGLLHPLPCGESQVRRWGVLVWCRGADRRWTGGRRRRDDGRQSKPR